MGRTPIIRTNPAGYNLFQRLLHTSQEFEVILLFHQVDREETERFVYQGSTEDQGRFVKVSHFPEGYPESCGQSDKILRYFTFEEKQGFQIAEDCHDSESNYVSRLDGLTGIILIGTRSNLDLVPIRIMPSLELYLIYFQVTGPRMENRISFFTKNGNSYQIYSQVWYPNYRIFFNVDIENLTYEVTSSGLISVMCKNVLQIVNLSDASIVFKIHLILPVNAGSLIFSPSGDFLFYSPQPSSNFFMLNVAERRSIEIANSALKYGFTFTFDPSHEFLAYTADNSYLNVCFSDDLVQILTVFMQYSMHSCHNYGFASLSGQTCIAYTVDSQLRMLAVSGKNNPSVTPEVEQLNTVISQDGKRVATVCRESVEIFKIQVFSVSETTKKSTLCTFTHYTESKTLIILFKNILG